MTYDQTFSVTAWTSNGRGTVKIEGPVNRKVLNDDTLHTQQIDKIEKDLLNLLKIARLTC
jgi:hypothetical protein